MALVLFLGLANKTNTESPKCSQKGRECGKRRRKMGLGMISAELHICLLVESLAYLKSLGNREGMTLQRQRGCKRSL